jgi:hypothetical protein
VSRPGRSLPPEKTRYPLYSRLGKPQGQLEQVRKVSPPPGYDLRTVQPVASRYTDYATWPIFIGGTHHYLHDHFMRTLTTFHKHNLLFFRLVCKITKISISSVMSVLPSICKKKLVSHWRVYHENLYMYIFLKSVEKTEDS